MHSREGVANLFFRVAAFLNVGWAYLSSHWPIAVTGVSYLSYKFATFPPQISLYSKTATFLSTADDSPRPKKLPRETPSRKSPRIRERAITLSDSDESGPELLPVATVSFVSYFLFVLRHCELQFEYLSSKCGSYELMSLGYLGYLGYLI